MTSLVNFLECNKYYTQPYNARTRLLDLEIMQDLCMAVCMILVLQLLEILPVDKFKLRRNFILPSAPEPTS